VTDPLYREYEKLVEIRVCGKAFEVPEKNTCLRALQYVSPETIPYGRFCWNQECQLCRIVYRMRGEPEEVRRGVLACKVLVAEGMEIVEVSEELRWTLAEKLGTADLRPAYED
jgi:hypothetical protein